MKLRNQLGSLIVATTVVGIAGCGGGGGGGGGMMNAAQAAVIPAVDPFSGGARPGANAGAPLPNLTADQMTFFAAGKVDFNAAEGVGDGLGPRFNLDSCGGCHSQPAEGGTSGPLNPQVAIATAFGAANAVPPFISPNGPIREARMKSDSSELLLFTISGRNGDPSGVSAAACMLAQPNFALEMANSNLSFRIPTPVFGMGLIEQISDATLTANLAANSAQKAQMGIGGRFDRGEDGTIARFGWKAQGKSMLHFSGAAYAVEMGITNELFPQENEENANCQLRVAPNDIITTTVTGATTTADIGTATLNSIDRFAIFMRFLGPPKPVTSLPASTALPNGATSAQIANGRQQFINVGCALCHTETLRTVSNAQVAALSNQPVNLFSDLALHHMGPGLADGILDGRAAKDEFRTSPLWGVGQRMFFLHDGRTKDLIAAITAHRSQADANFPASEANAVIDKFDGGSAGPQNGLSTTNQQDLLSFLRSL